MYMEIEEGIVPSSHSLQADLATGWKPKLKVIGPMPLNFDNPRLDTAIRFLLSSESALESVVYLGPRPATTFQMHELLAKRYKYKYAHLINSDFGHLKSFFHKFYNSFQPAIRRPFLGMNPNCFHPTLLFDSAFECGNLDCAILTRENQYDLILRIDSNTAGHILWYYFKVKNNSVGRRVKFNILNMRRNKSAYERGLRPYIKRKDCEWRQEGECVMITDEAIRYARENLIMAGLNDHSSNQMLCARKLSFQLLFEAEEEIQVCYSVPYSYSAIMSDIKTYRRIATERGICLDVDCTKESLSGLQIPILTITEESEQKKYCVYCIGRQHPGEANSSYVMKGMIEEVLRDSSEAKNLRKQCVFVMVPMINPDGVVMGNFRTSLFGKDLNRLYRSSDVTLIPEVEMARETMLAISKEYKSRFLMFLDVHGHSTRRNSFCFGPGILDTFSDIRLFPKIIARKNQIFRYPSCSFRVAADKKTTARALFTQFASLCYTIESSNWSYFSSSINTMIDFDAHGWVSIGNSVIQALNEFIFDRNATKKIKSHKKTQQSKQDQMKVIIYNKNTIIRQKKIIETTLQLSRKKQTNQNKGTPNQSTDRTIEKSSSKSTREIKHVEEKKRQFQSIAEEENQSDKMSEGGMDSESEGEDMEANKFKKYIHAASQMIIEFKRVYGGNQYKIKSNKQGSNKNIDIFKQKKKLQVLACLRKKQLKPQKHKKDTKTFQSAEEIKTSCNKLKKNIQGSYSLQKIESKQLQTKEMYLQLQKKNNITNEQLMNVNKLKKSISMKLNNVVQKGNSSRTMTSELRNIKILESSRMEIPNKHLKQFKQQTASPTLPKINKFYEQEHKIEQSINVHVRKNLQLKMSKINMFPSTSYPEKLMELLQYRHKLKLLPQS